MAAISPRPRESFLVKLRNAFLAGVAIVLPIVITGWLIWTFVSLVDDAIYDILPDSVRNVAGAVPGIGVMIALIALTIIGLVTANLFGQWLLQVFERLVSNLPIVRSIYGGSKQIFQQVAAPDRTSFKETVLVPYPRAGAWAIGFITSADAHDVLSEVAAPDDPLVAVFVPMSPIPTGGFLIYYPVSAIRRIDISPEEALKRLISFGIVHQETGQHGK